MESVVDLDSLLYDFSEGIKLLNREELILDVLLKAPYVVSDKCFFSLPRLMGQLLKVDSILASRANLGKPHELKLYLILLIGIAEVSFEFLLELGVVPKDLSGLWLALPKCLGEVILVEGLSLRGWSSLARLIP